MPWPRDEADLAALNDTGVLATILPRDHEIVTDSPILDGTGQTAAGLAAVSANRVRPEPARPADLDAAEKAAALFDGVSHVGYLPKDRIVGLSQLARIVEHYAAQPQTQQRLTTQVAECLEKISAPARSAWCWRPSTAGLPSAESALTGPPRSPRPCWVPCAPTIVVVPNSSLWVACTCDRDQPRRLIMPPMEVRSGCVPR